MNLLESLKTAFRSILSNKMRSILTMLGIIIGIGSVIMVTSIGAGSQAQVTDTFNSLGVSTLNVSVNNNDGEDYKLELNDVNVLKQHPSVANVSVSTQARFRYYKKLSTQYTNVWATMTNSSFSLVENLEFIEGRYFSEIEEQMNRKVIVIDEEVAKGYFGYTDCIGQEIEVNYYGSPFTFTVVGVVKNPYSKLGFLAMGEIPSVIYIPIKQIEYLWGEMYINQMRVMVTDSADQTIASAELANMLNRVHRTTDVFTVRSGVGDLETINNVLAGITLFISFVAGISLLVGGVGVMNIMLVTVTERTREIGIRKSLGAKSRDIRTQFLIEAIIITFMGSFIGTVLGYTGSLFIGQLINILPRISNNVIIITVIISAAIGIIFGVYPAHKASKLDPIEALRYE